MLNTSLPTHLDFFAFTQMAMELDVFVGNTTIMDEEVYQLWLDGYTGMGHTMSVWVLMVVVVIQVPLQSSGLLDLFDKDAHNVGFTKA